MSIKVTQYQDGISGATVIVENHEYLKDNDPKKYVIKVEVGEAIFRMTMHEWIALESGVHNMLVEAGCIVYGTVEELEPQVDEDYEAMVQDVQPTFTQSPDNTISDAESNEETL